MVTIEMVEKLCKYGNISFSEAKAALEHTDGNMLEAVIMLERQGKIKAPINNGEFQNGSWKSNYYHANGDYNKDNQEQYYYDGRKFKSQFKKFIKWCGKMIQKGNRNYIEVVHKGEVAISVPITVFVVLLAFFFWVITPLLIIGLFCNCRYAFRGPDLGNKAVNNASDYVSNAAEGLKNKVKDAMDDSQEGKNPNN